MPTLNKYREAVKEAKNLLAGMEKNKMKIAKLAYNNCEIIVGGHTTGEVYSLTMFAEDIGMNRKTLSDWVHNYQIKLIIEEEAKNKTKIKNTFLSLKDADTQRQMNDIRLILRAKNGGLKDNLNPKGVMSAVHENLEYTDNDKRIAALRRQIKNLEYAICHEGLDLSTLDQDELAMIQGFARNINNKLSSYFKLYEKPKVILRKQINTAGHKLAAKTKRKLRMK